MSAQRGETKNNISAFSANNVQKVFYGVLEKYLSRPCYVDPAAAEKSIPAGTFFPLQANGNK